MSKLIQHQYRQGDVILTPVGKMLCIPHWEKVPPKLQQLIYSARSSLKKSRKPETRIACRQRYHTLRDEAIQYVIDNVGCGR